MDNNLIDGKKWAGIHQQRLMEQLQSLNLRPKVVSILVGEDPASQMYTKMKQQKASEIGIDFTVLTFPDNAQSAEVNIAIVKLNSDPTVSGIMIQLPLPESFLQGQDKSRILDSISPQKDIDGLRSDTNFLPAAARAVLSILEDEMVDLNNKLIVVVGASGMVGKPLVDQFKKRKLLVSAVDEYTPNIEQIVKRADILISAVGKPRLISAGMVKDGAVVIDVGTTKMDNGRVVGDVDFESVVAKVSKITPVPGGVGPMTVISLMENVLEGVTNVN